MIKNILLWLRVSRPVTLTASIIPVTLGAVFSIRETKFLWSYYILSVAAIVLLQASANMLNDYYDFKSKVDTKESLGSSGAITKGMMAPKKVMIGGFAALGTGFLTGVLISVQRGLPVFILGLIGAISVYSYTGKPLELKYKGLGIPLVFFIFGPLMVLGSYYVQAQKFSLAPFIISIPVGLLTTAILHANDIRDIFFDGKAGIKTLSILVGKSSSHIIYYSLVIAAYLLILIMPIFRITPFWSLICLVTLPSAIKCIKKLSLSFEKEAVINILDQETAMLGAQFGTVFIVSLLIPIFIK